MLSFNHYAYGAVIDWVYRNVAGLAAVADRPGYRHVHIAPRPAAGLTWAKGSIKNSAYGRVSIEWRSDAEGDLILDVQHSAWDGWDVPTTGHGQLDDFG